MQKSKQKRYSVSLIPGGYDCSYPSKKINTKTFGRSWSLVNLAYRGLVKSESARFQAKRRSG